MGTTAPRIIRITRGAGAAFQIFANYVSGWDNTNTRKRNVLCITPPMLNNSDLARY